MIEKEYKQEREHSLADHEVSSRCYLLREGNS